MVNITVIGTGYVGAVSGACLADFGNHVVCVDSNAGKIEMLKEGRVPFFEPGLDAVISRNIRSGRLAFTTDLAFALEKSEVVFIAVGTPQAKDGGVDLSHFEAAVRQTGSLISRYTVIVDKSTVPAGTSRAVRRWIAGELEKRGRNIEFDVVSNPEFLREGTAVYDFTSPDRVVIGTDSKKARRVLKKVYRPLYLNETPFIETNPETAEMIKYASNAFLAVKITFINEIANLCEKAGADVQDVARAMGRDVRIGPQFLRPGPGYGGSCFPKDTRALAKTGREGGAVQNIVEAAINANEAQKLSAAKKIEAVICEMPPNSGGDADAAFPLRGKKIAVLGLAFKPNTSDIRESPAVTICEYLAGRGAELRVFDPAAMKEARLRLAALKEAVYFAADEYDAMRGASALAIVTEWNQFRSIDLARPAALLAAPYFFDFRNIYKRKEVEAAGLRYFGTGKPVKR